MVPPALHPSFAQFQGPKDPDRFVKSEDNVPTSTSNTAAPFVLDLGSGVKKRGSLDEATPGIVQVFRPGPSADAQSVSQNIMTQSVSQNVMTQSLSQNVMTQSLNQTVMTQTQSVSQTVSAQSVSQTVSLQSVSQMVSAHKAFSDSPNADRGGRLFSDVARAAAQPGGKPSLPGNKNLVVRGKDTGSHGASFPVRTDHLCNQHLIPEQFRKLIVPDMEKMMQLGRDNAWDRHPDIPGASSSGVQQGRAGVGTKTDASAGGGEKNAHYTSPLQHCVQRVEGSQGASPRGIRITAAELFASYEAAMTGTRNTQATKAQAIKAESAHDEGRPGHTAGSSEFQNPAGKKVPGFGGFPTTLPTKAGGGGGGGTRHQTPATKTLGPSPAGGRVVGVEQKSQQPGVFGASGPVSCDSRPGPSQQQQQTLAFSSHGGKGREQVMTAAYYANTRLNDVMTYASINIPGLPRIPILSPQAAAQNAFMMKTNSMRPCLQPNLSVPPPGFIPLMPVPTAPTFHHGPSAYPMGPIFQPGVFHSPNFITMTPHPSAPAFMQQTKVNICANVNINSSVSATFNINSSNNRNDNHNPVLTLNNNLRGNATSATSTTTTSTASAASADCGRKVGGEARLLGPVSALGGWSPLTAIKPAPSALKAAAVKAADAGNQDSESKPAGRHKASSDDGRNKDDSSGRTDQERWRGGGGGPSDNTSTNRPRGSNIDNLIHVFPPRQ